MMNAADILFTVILSIIAFAGGWFLQRFFNHDDVHDNGGTAQQVRDELDSVEAGQREAQDAIQSVTAGLDDSERAVGDIAETGGQLTESISNAQSSIAEGQQLIDDSGRRIAECENIIREVREGAHKD
ncbi:hypothetical protein [Selenomonas ruminantium]|uniref:Uncharacterized protein n=1 Tax=Selenomonas ruminantium TaxID=971 RepID=A0A1H0N377_SELRU|nr:hypothetical protein [Selenomonas ruminantium]SDO87092.1 hypothetical protein SAMN05216366_102155 [Selenomonas ruminantium]